LLTISAKPDRVGAACRLWIAPDEQIWIADAHRDNGKRYVVWADEKLAAFLELESAIRGPDFALTSR